MARHNSLTSRYFRRPNELILQFFGKINSTKSVKHGSPVRYGTSRKRTLSETRYLRDSTSLCFAAAFRQQDNRMSSYLPVVAVTCLALEARIAQGLGVSVVCQPSLELLATLRMAAAHGASGVISFGIAGGLAPNLVAGDWIVGSFGTAVVIALIDEPEGPKLMVEAIAKPLCA